MLHRTTQPASVFVRTLYVLCLIQASIPLFQSIENVWSLINYGVLGLMNVYVVVVPSIGAIALFAVVVFRVIGLVTGRFKLPRLQSKGTLWVAQVLSVCLLLFVVVPWLLFITTSVASRGFGQFAHAVLYASDGRSPAIAIVFFESIRLIERDLYIDQNTEG